MQKYLYITGLFLLICLNANGQADSSLLEIRLPPLHLLIETAIKNSSEIKLQESIVRRDKASVKDKKKSWSKNLYADLGYAYTNNLSVTNLNSGGGNIESVALINGGSYRAGITLKMSLYDFIGSKYVTRMAIHTQKASENLLLTVERKVTWNITKLYKDLLLSKTLLRIKSEKMQTLALQKQLAEKEFTQGHIKIDELGRLTELSSNAVQDFERGKNDYEKAYMKLELSVGKPLKSF